MLRRRFSEQGLGCPLFASLQTFTADAPGSMRENRAGQESTSSCQMAPYKILVVEDNEDLAFGLRYNLEAEGYSATVAPSGEDALAAVGAESVDLIVLDLTLPGVDGFRVLESIRKNGYTLPVMILTAKGDELDKVRGLRLGADDYLTKPFSLLEFIARIEALLRRGGGRTEESVIYRFGSI